MSQRVLSVGQCGPDHFAITHLIQNRYEATVVSADLPRDALSRLRRESYDLVLVNRKLDADYSDGLNVIRAMKADSDLAHIPVMLITNYEEHQKLAVAAGAEPGFGKTQYSDPATHEKLARFLRERVLEHASSNEQTSEG